MVAAAHVSGILHTAKRAISLSDDQQMKTSDSLLTPFAVRGTLEPDLLDEVTYWIEQ